MQNSVVRSKIKIRNLQLFFDGNEVLCDWLQLSLLALNSHSLMSINKQIQLTYLISLHNPDIECLCETWFDDNFADNVSLYPDYVTATRADRNIREHRGVLILFKYTAKIEALKIFCDFACAVKFTQNSHNLLLYVFIILLAAVNTELIELLFTLPSINSFLLTISKL